ncbi:uncharacterized protein ACA1_132130 [Acanthamoeba castellanii str. Neff]|uniref:Uncharacterized protein n=1 Tax=Acanthamoeba castellanii (strain ATCC 30010 / Neff) TaxID=1257118 RepID=L8GVH4_ACACF|nr:uncharacterized protein ACA1_132130 [Acanthamoeba castellanii str. Neff]ELR17020.1 hypothetical protein ACA1_132130 [Acanthamoeba castellanii str. Neff]
MFSSSSSSSLIAALLALACCLAVASATGATHSSTFSGAALQANTTGDLSGVWSALDDNGQTYTAKFVQQGNQLLLPSTRSSVQYSIKATLYGGYGLGQGALWQINNPSVFCSYTNVVVDVVDAGFMKITWFPAPAANGCIAFAGGLTKYTRPY